MSKASAFLTFSLSSQVLLLLGYSFHLTRYCHLLVLPRPPTLLSKIFFTLYFSSLSTLMGSRRFILGSLALPWNGSRRLTWNTGCIFIVAGSFNLLARVLTFPVILKGLNFLLSGFVVGRLVSMYFWSNQTSSPLLNAGASCCLRLY